MNYPNRVGQTILVKSKDAGIDGYWLIKHLTEYNDMKGTEYEFQYLLKPLSKQSGSTQVTQQLIENYLTYAIRFDFIDHIIVIN